MWISCHKRKKKILIKSTEGHRRHDGNEETEEIDHNLCRFNYPQFPSKKTKKKKTMFVPAMDNDLDEEEVLKRKNDLKKIRQFLIRQTGYG